jgi:hypothetical protein
MLENAIVSFWKPWETMPFRKLTMAFSSISPSQYSYFDVGTLF